MRPVGSRAISRHEKKLYPRAAGVEMLPTTPFVSSTNPNSEGLTLPSEMLKVREMPRGNREGMTTRAKEKVPISEPGSKVGIEAGA